MLFECLLRVIYFCGAVQLLECALRSYASACGYREEPHLCDRYGYHCFDTAWYDLFWRSAVPFLSLEPFGALARYSSGCDGNSVRYMSARVRSAEKKTVKSRIPIDFFKNVVYNKYRNR